MSTRIRQGDSLSQILFYVLMEDIVKEVRAAGPAYRIGDEEMKMVCYADDTVVVAKNEDDLQKL